MSKYIEGQIVYTILSDCYVQEVVVEEVKDREYILSLELAGYITMPEERIFANKKDAEAQLKKIRERKRNTMTYMDKISVNALGKVKVC